MSSLEKNQLKKQGETLDRVEKTQKKIDEKLRAIKIDDFINRLNDIETLTNESYSKAKIDELLGKIRLTTLSNTKSVGVAIDESKKLKNRMDERIEKTQEQDRLHDKEIASIWAHLKEQLESSRKAR